MEIVEYNNELLKIEFITSKIVRFHFSKDRIWKKNYSFCVNLEKFKEVDCEHREDNRAHYFLTSDLDIRIYKNPSKIQIYDRKGNLIISDYMDLGYVKKGNGIYSYKEMGREKAFLGFGERLGSLNKKGKKIINWNTDEPNHEFERDPLYQSHPFFLAYSDLSYGSFL